MTVLTACREAAVKLNQTQPASVFSSTADFPAQLALAANEAAEAIVEAYDWQKLRTLATISGDGSEISFALPTDYGRMLKKATVHSTTWQAARFYPAKDEDNWLYINDVGITGTPGTWIILGGRFQVFPAMPVGETARFYYISNKYVQGSTATQSSFTADADTFLLSEKLLRLGIVWRWLSDRKMEYAEALTNFEIALAEEVGKDKGSRILTVGRQRAPGEFDMAYPGTIVP
jgi:hypothetical protein